MLHRWWTARTNRVKWSSIIRIPTDNNIDQSLLIMIQKFLMNRTVTHQSDEGNVVHRLYVDVPLGSVLGPILFNVAMSVVHGLLLQRLGFHHNTWMKVFIQYSKIGSAWAHIPGLITRKRNAKSKYTVSYTSRHTSKPRILPWWGMQLGSGNMFWALLHIIMT